ATCPTVDGSGLAVPHPEQPGAKAIDWHARLDKPAQAVDQRVKMPVWMELFASRGGQLVIQDVGVAELEVLTASHDLVILAAGKGEVVKLFERDPVRSVFTQPQRALALTYVHGLAPTADYQRVSFNLIPGVGEYFVFPALTHSGPCDIMVFEGVPGGPMDCWADVATPAEHLARSQAILKTFLPWEAERARQVSLTDDHGTLAGRFTPTIRRPVLTLPSGRQVLGLGDAVAVNDPITGQGSNNATKAAKVYLDAILARGDQPFDAAWMQQSFEQFWDYAQWVVGWTNSLLTPPPPHILQLLGTAGACAPLAGAIANGFNHPPAFFPWWADADACGQFMAAKLAEPAAA
ncbi:MAG: alanine-phosphoribitol ligase, partial [Burkholderiales bacterium PBB5]